MKVSTKLYKQNYPNLNSAYKNINIVFEYIF